MSVKTNRVEKCFCSREEREFVTNDKQLTNGEGTWDAALNNQVFFKLSFLKCFKLGRFTCCNIFSF